MAFLHLAFLSLWDAIERKATLEQFIEKKLGKQFKRQIKQYPLKIIPQETLN